MTGPGLLARAARLAASPARLPTALARYARIARRDGLPGVLRRLLGQEASDRPLDYPAWVALHDSPSAEELAALARRPTDPRAPTLSVALVLDGDTALARRALDALAQQVQPAHELLLELPPGASSALRALAPASARLLEGRAGLPWAAALEAAAGAWILLLDARTVLSPLALLLATEAAADPGLDLLCADEDRLDAAGARCDPLFKPGLDPELAVALDTLSAFAPLRTSLARALGLRTGFAGAERYDLLLRALRRAGPAHARHLPHLLAHVQGAPGAGAEAGALAAAQDHLDATLPGAAATPGRVPGTRRVRPPLPARPPLVSVIIPTRDALEVLERCVEGLLARTRWPRLELIVVDNGSAEARTLRYLDELSAHGRARVLRDDGPFNYSRLNNRAAREARGELLALLNNDLEVADPAWMEELAGHALRPEIGAVGARLLYPDGRVQHAGLAAGVLGLAGHLFRGAARDAPGPRGLLWTTRSAAAVTGACLVVRRELYLRAGGLDERALAVAFNDVDLCLRLARLGYRNLWTPWAELVHHESWSRGGDLAPDRRARFEREVETMLARWPDLARDPLYNPNLALASEQWEPADPPRVERPWRTARGRS